MKLAAPENVYVHPNAICESQAVGAGSRVWAFAHILPGAVIGVDANICDHTFIENDVQLGDRVTVKSFVAIWDGVRVGDDVFIGPGVMFANDKYPRSKRHLASYPLTKIKKGASIGCGAIILPGLTIGEYAMVAAGTLVSSDVEDFTLVKGSPARPAGRVCKCGAPIAGDAGNYKCTAGNWMGATPSADMKCSEWLIKE